jgi:hypothetical protein
VYIPSKRSLQLVEIQESVLPEDEWLIGISDLGYFRGIGYSMPRIETDSERQNTSSQENLYAFLPGLFFCSSQQTSVDAVLIEVTERTLSGIVLPSFRPEDVRTFDVSGGITPSENGGLKLVEMTSDTLGSFEVESFLKDSGLSYDTFNYKREIQIASSLAKRIPLSELKRAYVSSSFLQSKLKKLLDDIEFYELATRNRIYLRNQKHPYGTIVEVLYSDAQESASSIHFPDDADIGKEVRKLVFSNLADEGEEINVEGAINDMRAFITSELQGNVSRQDVMKKLFEERLE